VAIDPNPNQAWLFDPGEAVASVRVLDRRVILREACRKGDVALLLLVAKRAGISVSTLWRWRRDDPAADEILRVVRERRRAGGMRRRRR
jgi:hypothetical protein